MKYMHKLLILFIVILFSFAGCTNINLKPIVNKYIEDNKTGKTEYIKNYGLSIIYGNNADKDEIPKTIDDALDEYISNLKLQVLSQDIDGNDATVMVEITSTNFIEEYFALNKKYMEQIIKGNDSPREEVLENFKDSLVNGSLGTRRKAVRFTKDKGIWNINQEDLAKAVFNIDKDSSFIVYLNEASYAQDKDSKNLSISQSNEYTKIVLGKNAKEISEVYEYKYGLYSKTYSIDDYEVIVTYTCPYKSETSNEFDKSKVMAIYFELNTEK